MSYRTVSTIPRLQPRPLRGMGSAPIPYPLAPPPTLGSQIKRFFGLGTMLDANVLTSAWYLPLVEQLSRTSANRSYQWAPMKYLSNWDALSYNMSFTNYTPTIQQESTLYQWDGSQWRKTSVQSSF